MRTYVLNLKNGEQQFVEAEIARFNSAEGWIKFFGPNDTVNYECRILEIKSMKVENG